MKCENNLTVITIMCVFTYENNLTVITIMRVYL